MAKKCQSAKRTTRDEETGVSAFGILNLANSYAKAARLVHASADMPDPAEFCCPTYFLAAHSVELSLKAYLRLKGMPGAEIIRFGHDLEKLQSKSEELGIDVICRFTKQDGEIIRLLIAYYKDKRYEYFYQGRMENVSVEALMDLQARLYHALEKPCLDQLAPPR